MDYKVEPRSQRGGDLPVSVYTDKPISQKRKQNHNQRRCAGGAETDMRKNFYKRLRKICVKKKKFVILRLQAAKQKPGLGRSGWAGRHNGKRLLGALSWLVGTWKTSITAKNAANSRCLVDMKTLSSAGA